MVKSKRKLNDDEETSPRRCSRRLNELQEDGTPVRRSTRLRNGSNRSKSPENKSARKKLVVSITQSARVPSKAKKKSIKSY